ncbi:hypothetical protein ACEPAH_3738 [Sanghuangporus vaninii]
MLSPENMLIKRSRMARYAHRGLSNVLKARFSPTAVWTIETEDADTATPTRSIDAEPPFTIATRETTASSVALTTRITTPTISSPILTPTPAQTTSSSVVATTLSSSISITVVQSTSTTSTTTSTTTSISSTRSSITPTTTIPTATLATSDQTTARVTRTVSSPAAVSSGTSLGSAASPTSSGTESSGITTAGVVGIAAAGIVGAVVIVSLVMFFIRRRNRKQDEYDPDGFKRQSVMLRDDDASLQRGNSSGRGGPRPPTMFERHNQNIAAFATIPTTYQSSSNSYGSANPFSDYASHSPPSFTPGMYVPSPATSQAPAVNYANVSPYYNPASQSPVGSPVTIASYGGAAYNAHGNLVRVPSNAAASMLARNNSVLQPDENSDYLTRASVTPFQAAQYEAISKQLNIPPPMSLQQVSEADETEATNRVNQGNPLSTQIRDSAPFVSPFEDHQLNTIQSGAGAVAFEKDEKLEPSRPSSEFHSAPEPASRVPSMPPSLPEIRMMSGSFSPVAYNFPVTPSPRKGSFDVASGRASPKVDLPPLSPVTTSPQRAQFVEGLEARAHDGHETPVEIGFIGKDESATRTDVPPSVQTTKQAEVRTEVPKTEGFETEAPKAPVPKRPETVYSDEDAYGGF